MSRSNNSSCGSDRGAALYSLIEIAKLNATDPENLFRDVLARIAEDPAAKLNELLPWRPLEATAQAA